MFALQELMQHRLPVHWETATHRFLSLAQFPHVVISRCLVFPVMLLVFVLHPPFSPFVLQELRSRLRFFGLNSASMSLVCCRPPFFSSFFLKGYLFAGVNGFRDRARLRAVFRSGTALSASASLSNSASMPPAYVLSEGSSR
jgi:hypothetical protein